MTFHHSGVSVPPLILVSFANLLRVHLVSLSMQLMKIFNSPGPNMDPWGTPDTTDLCTDVEPLTTILWIQPSSQFLIHCPSTKSNLERRMLTGYPVKGFTEAQVNDICSSSLSTHQSLQPCQRVDQSGLVLDEAMLACLKPHPCFPCALAELLKGCFITFPDTEVMLTGW